MKKLFSIILCLVLVFSTSAIAFAQGSEIKDCPYINVHGFMAADILEDKNDPGSNILWPPAANDILSAVKESLPALVSFVATHDYKKLGNSLVDPLNGILGKANLDSNGNAKGNSGVYFVYPDKSEIKPDSELYFKYDWRLDPIETAAKLNDFIDYVLDASGCDQVVLECHSFGGIITEAYTEIYGSSKLRSVCYNTTAIFGEKYTGELLSGQIVLDADALTLFLESKLGTSEYKKLINGIFDILNSAGITDDICALGNKIVEKSGEPVIREVIGPMFAGWLSIWAMCPDDYIESDIDYIFNDVYGGDISSHQGLYDKITRYNSEIRGTKKDTLLKQNEEINLYVISRYNYASIPAVPSWTIMSDSVVDSAASSFGAVYADFCKKLSDEIIVDHKDDGLVNPDCTVFAGSCLFPEQTWFIKNLEHSHGCDDLSDLIMTLLYTENQATVNTYSKFPRFLKWNGEDNSISADVAEKADKVTFFDKLFNYYLKILAKMRMVFEKIFR